MKNNQIKWFIFIFAAYFILLGAFALAQGRPPKPAGLPDLAITGMKVLNWDNCQTEITITNTGEADSGPGNLKIEAFYNNQWQTLSSTWPLFAVAAGKTAAMGVGFNDAQIQILLKSTKIKATLDPENKIDEKNETNNIFVIFIDPPNADLTITSIQVTDLKSGKVTVGVSNIGNAASVPTTFKIEAFSDNQWVNLGSYNFSAVQAGESKNFFVFLDEGAKQKLYTATKLKGTIDFYTNVPEKNENNNTLEVAVTPPKPDLVITGMKVLNWNNCQTEITIANMGEIDWGAFNIKIDAFYNNQWMTLGTGWPAPAIAPGQTTTTASGFNASQIQILLKSTKIRATLDPENKINEKNEANNTFEISINPPKPDLIINNMNIFEWKNWATEIKITNAGEIESGACQLKVEAFCNNQWQAVGTWPCESLKPGQTVEKNVMFPQDTIIQVLMKSSKLKATIDFNNEVSEKNDMNNTIEIPVLYPKADLMVTELKVLNWDNCPMKVTVANIGEVDSGAFNVRIDAFSDNQWQTIYNLLQFPSLAAGQADGATAGFGDAQIKVLLKATKIRAVIDFENKISEKNENNNVFEVSISPPNADLIITDLQMNDFKSGKVLVGFSNIGDAASAGTTFKLEAFSNNQWVDLGYYNFPNLKAGQNQSFFIVLDEGEKQKVLTAAKIKGTIDFYTNVAEKNENNNTLEKNVTITVNFQ